MSSSFGLFIKILFWFFKRWSLWFMFYPIRSWTRSFNLRFWILLLKLRFWYCRTKTNFFIVNLPANLLLNIFENRPKSRIVRIVRIYVSSRSWLYFFIRFYCFKISFRSSSKRYLLNSLLNYLWLKIFDDIFFKVQSRTWCIFNLYVALALRRWWHKRLCILFYCCILSLRNFIHSIIICFSAWLIITTLCE